MSNLPTVLVTHKLPENWLRSLHGSVNMITGPQDATSLAPELADRLGEAEGLFCLLTVRVDEALLARAPRLKVVSNMAVGFDNIDATACTRRGIPVGNTPGVLTEATADLTMALLLAVARQLSVSSQDAREGRWSTWRPAGWLGADLNGATLGIVGMGKIGQAVAQRARAFGMHVLYTDPQPRNVNLGDFATFEEILRSSDFVSLHAPLIPETRQLVDERALRMMKPSAYLINAARGPMVDTNALVRALQEGWIAGAGLDVTDPEPLPADHALYQLPNCLIVPHIGSATHNTRQRMAELACENLLAGLHGQPLPNCVNPQVYSGG
jgi:lactate dehydrogenase-like 2-hydroxyacid dehydrogenase